MLSFKPTFSLSSFTFIKTLFSSSSLSATRVVSSAYLLLLLLSRFSRVRLCATPEMAAHQAPRPWDSPGKNTGVGCHFLLQCRKVKNESEVTQSCPTLHDPMDCSLPGCSANGIFQARVLGWVAIAFSAAYLRLLKILPAILSPACVSSSPAFLMMYSAYKLNKQGDNTQPLRTPFPIWHQSVVPCPVLAVAS